MADLALGVDLGTTSTKIVACGVDGRVLGTAVRPSTVTSPAAGWAEMDPWQWERALAELVPEVLGRLGAEPHDVACLGVTGMVPTLVLVDAEDRPVHPSIQQNDTRALAEIDQLAAAVPDALVRTGSAVTAQSIGPKLHWLARHRPDVLAGADGVLGSYGWLVARLTRVRCAEPNWALESGLVALGDRLGGAGGAASLPGSWAYDSHVLAACGVRPALLPPVLDGVVGTVTAVGSRRSGLRVGTPVTAGCADHVVSAFAAGVLDPGDTLVKLGGAADVLVASREPVLDARLFLDAHPTGGWLPNGCMATSGSLVRWVQRELAGGAELSALDAAAADVGPGSGGVLVLPAFLGEKTPVQDPRARGAVVGLHLGHTIAHVHRATLEAVAFGVRHHLDVLAELGVPVRRVLLSDGGARSALWAQTVADVIHRPVGVLTDHPGSGWGAALLALGAVGAADPEQLVRERSAPDRWLEPGPAAAAVLDRHYHRYRDLQDALVPISHSIAEEYR